MPETAAPPRKLSPWERRVPDEKRNLVKGLYFQGLSPSDIASKVALSADLISNWAKRYGWSRVRAEARQIMGDAGRGKPLDERVRLGSGGSARVRALLADEVEAQASALRSVPAKANKLGNTPQGQGRASVAKTIAETASLVFDWEAQKIQGIVIIGEVEAADPLASIDVASAVQSGSDTGMILPEPESVPDAPDAPKSGQ